MNWDKYTIIADVLKYFAWWIRFFEFHTMIFTSKIILGSISIYFGMYSVMTMVRIEGENYM